MKKWLFIFLGITGIINFYFTQEKPGIIEKINGKEYYIHQVKKGESLYGISKLYGVEMDVILNENPFVKEKGLQIGNNIVIPVMHSKSVIKEVVLDTLNYKYHKVLKKQTVYSICKEYGISQDEFYRYNPDKKEGIKENDWVIVGKKDGVSKNDITIKKHDMMIDDFKKNIAEKTNAFSELFRKKKEYNVLLLLPFGADKAEELNVEDMVKYDQAYPYMSSMMIDFYTGMKYAADSLKSDSFNVRLLPIDIKETDSLKMMQMIHASEYKDADVIVGPVYSSLIKTEQQFSNTKKHHIIPFVSQNKFLFNHPEYSKTTPSIYVDVQVLSRYVFDSLRKKSEVVLLYGNGSADKEYAKEFKKYYNDWVYKDNSKDTVRTFKSITDFKKYVKDKHAYTVVLLTNNQVIATDYITQLSIINKTSPIYLCGFYKTTTFDNLDLEYLSQMNFVFPYYQNASSFVFFGKYDRAYKEEFQTDPSVFFYEGLQVGLYYFNLIKNYGLSALYDLKNFGYSDNTSFMRFDFYRPDENTGYQNNGEFIFKVSDRKIVLIK